MLNDALFRVEAVVDGAGKAADIEAALPIGVRPRQLAVRTLLVGIALAIADDRPVHLTRVHRALLDLDDADARRLGVVVEWPTGPHRLTYRQLTYTLSLVARALEKDDPDGQPSEPLGELLDTLCEASVPEQWKQASSSIAVDWSDHESFARPPTEGGGPSADPEAAWGHRSVGPSKTEMFFGYYLQTATQVEDEGGHEVPELIRRMSVTSCSQDPPRAFVPVLTRMVEAGVEFGDVLCDSGYAHRVAEHWALPVRRLGATLVMDLHPHDRGTRGTYHGAICSNGSLYCPRTPPVLFELGPLSKAAGPEEIRAHDDKSAELDRYRLGTIAALDHDGFHRVMCPAALGKLRCPARPESMSLGFDRPQVTTPPEHPPPCCSQLTITVGPEVNAKTAQKHPYPSKAHRRSYARRTGVERGYSTLKDPATTDTTRGWCRVMGLPAMSILLVCAVVVRNLRVIDAFEARQGENARRAQAGLGPKTRRRRRTTIGDLVAAAAPP